jgi:hypothetical protein
MVMKVYEYPPIKIGEGETPEIVFKDLVSRSCDLFRKRRPDYRLGNLNVEKLTSNVIKAVDSSIPNKVAVL